MLDDPLDSVSDRSVGSTILSDGMRMSSKPNEGLTVKMNLSRAGEGESVRTPGGESALATGAGCDVATGEEEGLSGVATGEEGGLSGVAIGVGLLEDDSRAGVGCGVGVASGFSRESFF